MLLPLFVFAYDDKTTHPALTQEIVKFFNSKFRDLKIPSEDAEYIIQGSIDEDSETRWMQHFYDPIYNRGLVLYRNELNEYSGLAAIIAGARSEFQSSKNWAQDTITQAGFSRLTAGVFSSYFSGEKDFSWDRAIYEYTWEDRKRGLKALGHTLHLIEDASVPDHTRNDPHPPVLDLGSPYEWWTKKFDSQSFNFTTDENPILLPDLNSHFNTLANYSNNNFFSKDTIISKDYPNPQIIKDRIELLSNGISYHFGLQRDKDGQGYRLVRIEKEFGKKDPVYSIKDVDNLILSDYWSLLSKQAVLHGAGVIKLFFDEVEKEKQSKTLYEKNRSWVGKRVDALNQWFSQVKRSTSNLLGFAGAIFSNSTTPTSPASENTALNQMPPLAILPTPQTTPPTPQTTETEPTPAPIPPIAPPNPPLAAAIASIPQISPPPPTAILLPLSIPNTIEKPLISSEPQLPPPTASSRNSTHGTPSPPSPASPPIPQDTSTPPSPPPPSPAPPPPSPPPEPSPPADITPPNLSFKISECNQSLSSEGCLITRKTLTLELSSDAKDLSHFSLSCERKGSICENFDIATTTATTTVYTANENQIYTFKAKALDLAGNESAENSQSVEIFSKPLVINEVAWAGTSAAKDQDEWLEIFNPTSKSIDLSEVRLKSLTDAKPNIQLSGTILAGGYYIIERTDDTTISDIPANLIAPFGSGQGAGLSNSGEILALEYRGATLDQTPDPGLCGGWCGGVGNPDYFTMERFDPMTSGEDKKNWDTWPQLLGNGKNADNLPINGTPGKRNGLNYFLVKNGNVISKDTTLKKSRSPYIIRNDFLISSGLTLAIEPGVIIKFFPEALLTIDGVLKTEGTVTEKIIFTSFKDDEYGGDTNQDGSLTSPAAGDWQRIQINGDGSSLTHAILRYGGDLNHANSNLANLRVRNASSFSLKNSTLEHAGRFGLWLEEISGTIEENTFNHNGNAEDGAGIMARGGTPTIRKNLFLANSRGLELIETSPHEVSANRFEENFKEAVHVASAHPIFSGNTASGNGLNAIELTSAILEDHTIQADLPYVIRSNPYSLSSNTTLTILAGTVIKLLNASLAVGGTLIAKGTAEAPVVLTSFNDDEYGGDTNGTTTPAKPGDWFNIAFGSDSADSLLKHILIRYGGDANPFTSGNRGALRAIDTSIEITDSVIEKNAYQGIRLEDSPSSVIRRSKIRDHKEPADESIGLYLKNSNVHLDDLLFKNNDFGIQAEGTSSTTVSGAIIFEENIINTVPADFIP